MRTLTSCALHIDQAQLESHARHGTVDFPIGCYVDDLAREPVDPHWHDALEVFLVVEGTAAFTAGPHRRTLSAGEGLFINAGVVHGAVAACDGPAKLHTLVFHPNLVAGSAESVFWQEYVGRLVDDSALQAAFFDSKIPWQASCLDAARTALDAYLAADFGHEFRVREGLSRLVCELVAHQPAADRPVSTHATRNANRIKAMLACIHDRYAENLQVDDIAAAASISASECLRCFHETLGTTPVQYLKQYRVRRAARMLASTDLPIAQVGALCGFGDAGYFARVFRAAKGCTPKEFRQASGV